MARDWARQAAETAREEEAREAALRREEEATKAVRREQELAEEQRHEAQVLHASEQHHLRKTLLVWREHAQANTREREQLQALEFKADIFYAARLAREALCQWQASVQQAKALRQEQVEQEERLIQAVKMQRLREGVLLVRLLDIHKRERGQACGA